MSIAATSNLLADATRYPKFCPSCGQHRQVELATNKDIIGTQEIFIKQCLRCGFKWDRIRNPDKAVKEALLTLNDQDLVRILRSVNEAQKKIYAAVSQKHGTHATNVQFAFEGKRNNPDLLKLVLQEFRERLTQQNAPEPKKPVAVSEKETSEVSEVKGEEEEVLETSA